MPLPWSPWEKRLSVRGFCVFLLKLAALGMMMQILLYLSGTYHVRNFMPGGRNNLWLMPLVIPVLGSALATCLQTVALQRIVSVAFLLGGPLIYDSHARFLDAEYMMPQADYDKLMQFLSDLNPNDVIVTDRMVSFQLSPEDYNAYRFMKNAVWADGDDPKIVPYGHAAMLFAGNELRFYGLQDMQRLYGNPQAAELLRKADRLVFISLAWPSPMVKRLAQCGAIDKTVVVFPEAADVQNIREKTATVVIVPRKAFERNVLAPGGKARGCFGLP